MSHTGLEPVTSSMSRMRASQLRQWLNSSRIGCMDTAIQSAESRASHYKSSLAAGKCVRVALQMHRFRAGLSGESRSKLPRNSKLRHRIAINSSISPVK